MIKRKKKMDKINNETMDNLNEDTATAETNPNEDIKVTVNDSNSETNKLCFSSSIVFSLSISSIGSQEAMGSLL